MTSVTADRSFRAIGTTVSVVVTDPAVADEAERVLHLQIDELDRTCSRFRNDSELARIEQGSAGRWMAASPLLGELLRAAVEVAELTGGTVDPTVGGSLVALGYDADFETLSPADEAIEPVPAPGWWRIGLREGQVAIPEGVHVDLGASAKAFAADRAASEIFRLLGCGVLVNLGGDIALAGPAPVGGWPIGIGMHCSTPKADVAQVIGLDHGAVATSGTTTRVWHTGGERVHHIVDPATGRPAATTWSLVSVAAPTCLVANALSTAAVIWGPDAPGHLAGHGVAARLQGADGAVVTVGSWPGSPSVVAEEVAA